jgi:hypothetical protein
MWASLQAEGILRQKGVVRWLREAAQGQWLYRNRNRNWAIEPEVLKAFHELHAGHEVTWKPRAFLWKLEKK